MVKLFLAKISYKAVKTLRFALKPMRQIWSIGITLSAPDMAHLGGGTVEKKIIIISSNTANIPACVPEFGRAEVCAQACATSKSCLGYF